MDKALVTRPSLERVMLHQRVATTALLGIAVLVSSCALGHRDEIASAVVAQKRHWELGWSTEWTLIEASYQQVGDLSWGYVLTWERREMGMRRVRRDAISEDWRFLSANESLYRDDFLVARGNVIVTPYGQPLFRVMAVGRPAQDIRELKDIDHYELEVLEGDRVTCRYKSEFNFGYQPSGDRRGLDRVPEDTVLVEGEGCPSVQELAENPFRKLLPEESDWRLK